METISLTVISPHLDDAAFSLGFTLTRLSELRYGINIINCYTVSKYAPYSQETSTPAICELRMREDAAFLANIASLQRVINLERRDAPLRGSEDVCDGRDFTAEDTLEADSLSAELSPVLGENGLLLPIALGHHIDHRIARNAALMASSGPLGFFEDLPYAIYYDDKKLRDAVHEIEAALELKLHPIVVTGPNAILQKQRLVELYPSQAGSGEINAILNHSKQFGGGERIWVDAAFLERLSLLL